ncbi:MAG: hypothetical protein FJ387_23370 [Verrucomicrobia bacterium]|nr:hypothetical protein [Verrucomicrobiota bacterium]
MTAVEEQWSPVKHLILGEDPQVRVYAEVSVWNRKIGLFRKGEEERLFSQDPTPEDLAVHKSLLQRLITDGEHLLSLIRHFGLPENLEGISLESVRATLDLLQADYRGWHDPMAAEQRARFLREVFPDVP